MPRTVLGSLLVNSFNPHHNQGEEYSGYPHFTDMELRDVERLVQDHLDDKGQSQDLNPDCLAPKLRLTSWLHEVLQGVGSD